MDHLEFMLSPHTLPVADSNPLPPELERRSTFNGSFHYKSLSIPSVLNTENIFPADDTSQRRLDQFPAKVNSDKLVFMPDFRALLAADGYPLSPDLKKQSNLSPPFTYKSIPDTPVLDKEIKTPAYGMSQRRLDQFSAKENNDKLVYMPDFRALLTADRYPLSPHLIEQSNLSPPFTYKLIPDPPVLDKEIKFPADNTSQRRLDQMPIKTVTSPGEACLVGADHSSHDKLSFLESPSSATAPQSESSMASSTGKELMPPEETGADIDKLTPLKKAELMYQLAKKRKAPLKIIKKLYNKLHNEKRKFKKSMLLKKLEAKLTPEQITQIKNKSLKCVSDYFQEYNFVMIHLTEHADKRLTKNHTLEDLCDAIVDEKNIGLEGAEYEIFSLYKGSVKSTFSTKKCRRIHAEYIKQLTMANEITEQSMP